MIVRLAILGFWQENVLDKWQGLKNYIKLTLVDTSDNKDLKIRVKRNVEAITDMKSKIK
jgi:hypothetical protein